MSEKRRGLGRGLGALIPPPPPVAVRPAGERPVDVFFNDRPDGEETDAPAPEPPSDSGSVVDPDVSGEGDKPEITVESDLAVITTEAVAEAPVPAATPAGPELVPVPGAYFAEIPVGSIVANRKQPRQVFDEDALAELVHSVREIGVLQPIVVRSIPESEQTGGGEGETSDKVRFELIMGERRWRASQMAELATIPAIVRDTSDDDLLRDALLENLHRSDLNPLEEAAAYQQLLDDFGCTHEQLATRIGRSRPQISNTIRLLRLPPAVQRRVAAGVLSAGHARALLGLEDAEAMDKLAARIVAEGLSVRATEEAVAISDSASPGPTPRRKPRAGAHHAELDDLATRLADRLDTRVAISLGRNKGKISVEFASVEDLNRILELLAPEERKAFQAQ
jgi:ParB family transcriptional regulator, chromosome partitioning protein